MTSQTIHVIGYAPVASTEPGTTHERLFYAMSKTEMAQQARIAEREGLTISHWMAQTKAGARMLAPGWLPDWSISAVKVKLPNLKTCRVCDGIGEKDITPEGATIPWKRQCVVCRGSGICQSGHEKKWRDWQLDNMRAEFDLPKREEGWR